MVGSLREVYCWGRNNLGQLGNGTYVDSVVPVKVNGLEDVADVQTNGLDSAFACALQSDGQVWCWGSDSNGRLGNGSLGSSAVPTQVSGVADAVLLSVGSGHACIIREGGGAECWGFNSFAAVGDGTTVSRDTPVHIIVPIGKTIARIDAQRFGANASTFVYTTDNTVYEIGNRSTSYTLVESLTSFHIRGGSGSFKCHLDSTSGRVSCGPISLSGCMVGSGRPGTTLGNGSTCFDSGTNHEVINLESGGVALSVGEKHACAVKSDGKVYCFGQNDWGQLGTGDLDLLIGPQRTYNGIDVAKVALNSFSSCVIDTSGGVWCSGLNNQGQLGNGTTSDSTTPVQVSGITAASHLCARSSTDNREGYCAIDGSEVKCWGWRYQGDGINRSNSSTPILVSGLTDITPADLACGLENTCVLATSGEVRCWGNGRDGMIGNGSDANSLTPVAVSSFSGTATLIGGTSRNFCVGIQGGGVDCWGRGNNGALGNGTTSSSNVPVSVSNLTVEVSLIASSGGVGDNPHTCVVLSGGGIRCWGDGPLGDGTDSDSSVPVAVSGYEGIPIVDIAVGDDHTCVVRSDGQVACWGSNDFGQLGTTSSGETTPQLVPGINTAVSIATSPHSTCVVLSDSSLRCFGYNAFGQLGNGHSNSLSASNPVNKADSTAFRPQVRTCRGYSGPSIVSLAVETL